MMNAYDKKYLRWTRNSLGLMISYGVYDLEYDLNEFWDLFLNSRVCLSYESGDLSLIIGRSGIEQALIVLGIEDNYPEQDKSLAITPEYWLGHSLAYFQWKTSISFRKIIRLIPIKDILSMYHKYHEMDIEQFCDELYRLFITRKKYTNLKNRRIEVGYSQSKLASISSVPLRTLQQYEQGQKYINNAKTIYVLNLSKALFCKPSDILE